MEKMRSVPLSAVRPQFLARLSLKIRGIRHPLLGSNKFVAQKFIENDVGNPKYIKIYCQKYQDVTPSPSERAGVRPPIGYQILPGKYPKNNACQWQRAGVRPPIGYQILPGKYPKNNTCQWQKPGSRPPNKILRKHNN